MHAQHGQIDGPLGGAQKHFSYAVHSVRGDATNAKIGDSKAHVCEVASMFQHLPVRHRDCPVMPMNE
eukprot:4636219-Pyramimonas_sp.AAC.1